MVRKSKGSDAKYVTILANQIIKPLVRKYLLGDDSSITLDENSDVKPSVSVRGKKVKLIKCPHCEKTSYSGPEMKGHITKMHNKLEKCKTAWTWILSSSMVISVRNFCIFSHIKI